MRDDSPWDEEGFRLKNIPIHRTVSRKIACIVGMYTSDPSGRFHSLQYESSTYLRGWYGVGRLISDRMSYRNHYMCSGEATSTIYRITNHVETEIWFIAEIIDPDRGPAKHGPLHYALTLHFLHDFVYLQVRTPLQNILKG